MKWKREDWQGRTQKQVEENYKTMEIVYVVLFVIFVGYLVSSIF